MARDLLASTETHQGESELFTQPAGLPDPLLTTNAGIVLEKRYLRKVHGKPTETPGGGLWRVAQEIARGSAAWESEENLARLRAEYYLMMARLDFLPNSPTLMNAGKGNGLQYSACYVLPVGDSMEEIFETNKRAALIHQSGGGTGFAFSRLRPAGDLVGSTGGIASGPVSFLEVYNASTESVKQGGCVVPDTLVTTNRGIVPIRELGPASAPADSWHPHARPLAVATDEGPRTSGEFYVHGVAPVRRVRTRRGYHLAATPEHRIRVIDEAGRYVWRHMRDLRQGDWVVLQKGHLLEPEDYSLPSLAGEPHPNASPVRIPAVASEQLGEFIGYLVGDGSFNRYNRGGATGRLILTICDEQPDVSRWLTRTAQELFGLAPILNKKKDDGSTNYFLNATTLVNWLQQIGVGKPSAREVRVPPIIFRRGIRMARGFLRGLFSADGTVSSEGYPSLCSVSEALISDVQQLLLAVGIPSGVSVTTNRTEAFGSRPIYRLRVVTHAGIEVFARTIGVIDAMRSERLAHALGHPWEFNDVIPHQEAALEAAYAGPGRGSGPMRGPRGANRDLYRDIQHYLPDVTAPRNLTRSRLALLADRHQEIRNSPLARFLANDQFYDQIETIEEGEALTLDLSVPENNTYIANGFVSHNTRRGANMGILRIDHPDVLRFIDCKRELSERQRAAFEAVAPWLSEERQRALKRALLEGQIANFNISVAATDRFMQALEQGEPYELVNPRTGQVASTLSAREVFDRLVHGAWETGDPGVVFIDRINAGPANPVPSMGPVEATNPCGEQPLYPDEACNLGSLNLARFIRPKVPANGHSNGRHEGWREAIDWERLERVARLSVRFLDDVIEVNPYPDQQIDQAVRANRRIGLGVMGWADLLVLLGIPYDSEPALQLGEAVMRFINETAQDESCRLAEVRGPFPNWSRSIYRDGRPRRNATVTTIAPTGTISIIAGCSSGIEPVFALVFDRRGSLDGQLTLETNPYFEEIARREGFWTEGLAASVRERGTARGVEGVPELWQRVFGTAHDIHPNWHVRMQAAFQKHTENAVSKTINLPHTATVDDVARAYRLAYELGCNGITVYRDGSKEGVLHVGTGGQQPGGGGQGSGAGDQALATRHSPLATPIGHVTLRPRPRALLGRTYRQETPLGTAYVTINEDEDGQPYEVFVNQGKAGSDVAALAEAIGKLISTILRTPSTMPARDRLAEVVRKLRGIGGSSSWGFGPERSRSLPDAVAKVLDEYLQTAEPSQEPLPVSSAQLALPLVTTGEFCPDCGNALIFEEACYKCRDCGFSKC